MSLKIRKIADGTFTGFSRFPLRLASFLAFVLADLSGFSIIAVILLRLLRENLLPASQASVLLALLFLFGAVQLISLGIIGETIGRLYDPARSGSARQIKYKGAFGQKNLMSTIELPSPAGVNAKNWLAKPITGLVILKRQITPAAILLSAVVLLSIGLHFYNLQSIGNANTYYTAAVKSMLQSWHNFFFVAAEPGGSVTVDKPPLGLWIEAAFAAVLGVSGFSVVLPNLLAGVLSVPLLYQLVKKYFGAGAGLLAALVLAVTPVSLAVDRNNTIDGMLIFTLLLAAWAFITATETGRLRYLLLGAFLVGLGFNIKMLQAFLPLPAFYALYFFGSKIKWPRKLLNLGLASLLLVIVSLAWAVAVDLTPASQRPYVGSSTGNSEMELIFGYNGINRLLGMMGGRMPGDGRNAPPQVPLARQVPLAPQVALALTLNPAMDLFPLRLQQVQASHPVQPSRALRLVRMAAASQPQTAVRVALAGQAACLAPAQRGYCASSRPPWPRK